MFIKSSSNFESVCEWVCVCVSVLISEKKMKVIVKVRIIEVLGRDPVRKEKRKAQWRYYVISLDEYLSNCYLSFPTYTYMYIQEKSWKFSFPFRSIEILSRLNERGIYERNAHKYKAQLQLVDGRYGNKTVQSGNKNWENLANKISSTSTYSIILLLDIAVYIES